MLKAKTAHGAIIVSNDHLWTFVMLSSYWLKALILFLVSYIPGVGMYIIVPAALATELRYLSVVGWATLGAFAPALTIVFFYDQLIRDTRAEAMLNRFTSDRLKRWAENYGAWFVFLISPWLGTWVTGVTAKTVQMDSRRYLLVSGASILIFAAVQAGLILLGVRFVPQSIVPDWLQNLL